MTVGNEKVPTFSSFFMAGFECTYALNNRDIKMRLDLLRDSKHDEYCSSDYKMIKELGISTVREGLAWHQVDQGDNVYDFSRFEQMMNSGREESIQQIWDLNHFDYPAYLDPFSPTFITQFAEYARRAWSVIRKYQQGTLYIVPMNEISFFSWFGADNGQWAPFKKGPKNGFKFKIQLVKAALAAMDAIWAEDRDVRFVQVDPIMRRIPREPSTTEIRKSTQDFNRDIRFQAWDMLCGKTFPELGGDPKYLDIIGVNYYMVNQEWVVRSPFRNDIYHLMIPPGHQDRVKFEKILQEIYDRYHRPLLISETGSHGEFRPMWWEHVLSEIDQAKTKGLPIIGVCAYPTVDKPTEIPFLWPQSGLWDFDQINKKHPRYPSEPTLDVIRGYINKWK
jgi:beta-glucosidase/6-phospho-beta-glucosidase/beta-galactosidase